MIIGTMQGNVPIKHLVIVITVKLSKNEDQIMQIGGLVVLLQ